MSDPSEMVAALKPVAEALSLLRIPYYLGGSIAGALSIKSAWIEPWQPSLGVTSVL